MAHLRKACWSLVIPLGLALLTPVRADALKETAKPRPDKSASGKFLRVKRGAKGEPLALETAIVRYVPSSGEGGLTVDLIGAVHVGDRAYYEALNKQFERYDVLLYELVAPPGTRIPKGGKRDGDSPIGMIQQMVKMALDLESQTEQIDYTKKNFVHADLSWEGMGEAMRSRGEDGMTLALGIAADMLRQFNLQETNRQKGAPKEDADVDIFSMLLDSDGSVKLKRLLAEQFEAQITPDGGLGRTLNTLLVVDRNRAALRVFQKELVKGKKKIGIFYGAAHLPDFEERLQKEFGLKRQSEQWLSAWNLKSPRRGIDELFKILR